MNVLCRNKEVFPLCDGLRLFLLMALSIAMSHNHRSLGTPLECLVVLTIKEADECRILRIRRA